MPSHWARLSVDLHCDIRRGAWYRVRRFLPHDVVLEVNGNPHTVPRSYLQVTSTPPSRWTIVSRPAHGGVEHAVCPGCRTRALLSGHPQTLRCPRCNGLFDVAWNEGNLAEA